MRSSATSDYVTELESQGPPSRDNAGWVGPARILWVRRAYLLRAMAISMAAGVLISLVLPKRYTSVARIMPPEQQGSSGLMMAALASKAGLGSLGSLAPIFFTGHSTTSLFVDLLRSGTVSGNLIERFDLKKVYGKKYTIDAAKRLKRDTSISDDKRSGVITIAVEDRDPARARDIAQGYLDELNKLVVQTNTSAAHRERVFLEERLQEVRHSLVAAEGDLSDFSTRNGAVDLKEQTRGMVDAGARVETQLMLEEATLNSLRQGYADDNVRVRETEARVAALRSDLARMGRDAQQAHASDDADPMLQFSPALRDVPKLSVSYAELYRRVKIQETLLELLTQQYEAARIEEVKDIPVVSVIDVPGVPEKKSFPPRTLLTIAITLLGTVGAGVWLLMQERWRRLASFDPRKVLVEEMVTSLRAHGARGVR